MTTPSPEYQKMVKFVMLLQSKEAAGLELTKQEANILRQLREKGVIPPKE